MAVENTPANPEQPSTKETPTQDQATEERPEDKPKYTDKQLNDLIAKESAKRAEGAKLAMLKEYGIESPEALAELKKLRDEKMTDSEKTAAALKEKDEAAASARAEAEAARAEVEALKRGVPADRVAKVVRLAGTYDGATMAEKIAAVLVDFPEMATKPAGTAGNMGRETAHQEVSEQERMLALARKQAGLTK